MNVTDQMAIWQNAGVTGGIPDIQNVQATVAASEDVQAAIDAAHNAGGGVVLLGRGIHEITEAIIMRENVVVRGVDRNGTRIETDIEAKIPEGGLNASDYNATFVFAGISGAGLENLTMENMRADFEPDPFDFTNEPDGRDDLYAPHIFLDWMSSNNWVQDTNVINAGSDPIVLKGFNHTMTGNFVSGAYNKGGGGNG